MKGVRLEVSPRIINPPKSRKTITNGNNQYFFLKSKNSQNSFIISNIKSNFVMII